MSSGFGLTTGQLGIWLAEQLMPGTGAYTLANRIPVTGPAATRERVEQACRHALRAHPSLSARIALDEHDAPVQIFDNEPEICFVDRGDHEVEALDLDDGPLARLLIRARPDAGFDLDLFLHHIISDSRSIDLFVNSLVDRFERAETPAMSVAELNRHIEAELGRADAERAGATAFWHGELPPSLDRLVLPGRDVVQTTQRGHSIVLQWPEHVAARLGLLARSVGASMFHVTALCTQRVLASYGNHGPVVLAVAANVRPPESQHVFGCFINLVPLILGPGSTLEDVRDISRRTLVHRACPFRDVTKLAAPVTRGSGARMDQILVTYYRPEDARVLDGLVVGVRRSLGSIGAKAALVLRFEGTASGISCQLDGAAERFDPAELADVAVRLDDVVRQIADASPRDVAVR